MKNKGLIKNIENKKIEIEYTNKPVNINMDMRAKIDEYWKEVSNIFTRGKIFYVKNVLNDEEKTKIEICYSDYAHYIYTRRHDLKLEEKCKSLWSGILLETLDNKYVFGEMSNITATSGEYHISAGSCDEKDLENGKMNYEKTMFRELKEELNIDKKDLKDVKLKYLKYYSNKEADVGLLYKGILNKTSLELKEDYEKYLNFLKETNGEIEFNRIIFVEKDEKEIKEFIDKNEHKLMEFTEEILLDDLKK